MLCSIIFQPSGLSGTRPKVNIWQQVDEEGEMDAPDVHNLVHENLHLDGVRVYDQHSLEQGEPSCLVMLNVEVWLGCHVTNQVQLDD